MIKCDELGYSLIINIKILYLEDYQTDIFNKLINHNFQKTSKEIKNRY